MIPLGAAVILVMDPPMTRTAGLVYRTPGGIGWVEPGYWLDPGAPRPAWHEVDGTVTETDTGILVQSEDQAVLAIAVELAEDHPTEVAELEELAEILRARGTSLAEQRLLLAPKVGAVG